jgi:hypothetical protein
MMQRMSRLDYVEIERKREEEGREREKENN